LVAVFLGLAPLPGQKDNTTPHTQPSTSSPQVEAPKGPPPSVGPDTGAVGPTAAGGTPGATPGGPTEATSAQTMTGDSPKRGANDTAAR
jgi:hypothetical protein